MAITLATLRVRALTMLELENPPLSRSVSPVKAKFFAYS